MNDRKSETPRTEALLKKLNDNLDDPQQSEVTELYQLCKQLERELARVQLQLEDATDDVASLSVERSDLADEVKTLRQQIEAMRGALGQASFCLRELLPNDEDAQMTVRLVNRALQEKAK